VLAAHQIPFFMIYNIDKVYRSAHKAKTGYFYICLQSLLEVGCGKYETIETIDSFAAGLVRYLGLGGQRPFS
jgi:hypothetical protein